MASVKKGKCKYWDKCFRKEQVHKDQFLHPGDDEDVDEEAMDVDDEECLGGPTAGTSDDSASPATEKTTVDLTGKKVLFIGTFKNTTVQKKASQAVEYGCTVTGRATEDVDMVVAGEDGGAKEKKAKDLGLRIVTEGYWEDLVSRADPLSDSPPAGVKRKRTHDVSDDDEAGTSKPPLTRTRSGSLPAEKKQKTGESSTSADKSKEAGSKKPKKIAKCRFWEKCYRKEPDHLKTFLHPSDDPSELAEPEEPESKTLSDDEEVEIEAAGKKYKLRRNGNNYTCNCIGYKSQSNKPLNKRTCKHLKDYLGETTECKRTGAAPTPAAKANKGGEATVFRAQKHKSVSLLLAHKWTEEVDPKGWWMSEKLDGVRAFWDGKGFFSRLGNEFIPPPDFIKNFPTEMTLDGELFCGRAKFQSTVSIVKCAGSKRWSEVEYHVFDAPSLGKEPFEKRIKEMREYFDKNEAKPVVVVAHKKVKSQEHIEEELEVVETLGGEGLMIRQPGSKYEHRRSNTLLKIKNFYDAEARIVGYQKGKGRNASCTGALVCVMECGKQFKVGSGLTDQDRVRPPKIGTIITYKFQEYTASGVPRFPSYLGIRIDMNKPKDAVLHAGKKQMEDA